LANQLRLDVAQLTDVGKKREHNEDNMAHVIPKDAQVMAMKGALFIVADGMGGHAAGEVASEIAVDTVTNSYYMDDSLDVVGPLLVAIKRANAAIHQRAAENMLRSGMGTTCVAAVLRGNVAYIANVGDSRAYIIRQGQVKQVSLDHSWVAEQVRAGLLTDEQARSHAQRNVITRSLGTQPDVEVDVFREAVQPGDSLVLCTDGLSGLVGDEELMRIVEQSVPQESVYHLVERANENGGPDNITAIVIRVQEVGAEPSGALNPALIGGREVSEEETIALNMLSGSSSYAVSDRGISSGSLRLSSGPLASPDSVTAPQPTLARARRSRLFFPTLILVFLLVVALGGGGVFYVLHLNESQAISQTLKDAGQLITQARGQSPTKALITLSNAQHSLQTLQKNHQLDSSQMLQFNTLQTQLAAQTRAAIASYNTQSKIFSLPCSGSTNAPVNPSSGGVQAASIAAVQNGKSALLFALGTDGALYQLSGQATSQYSLVSSLPASAASKILAIASGGTQLFLLNVQLGSNNVPKSYTVTMYTLDQSGKLVQSITATIDQQFFSGGFAPLPLITAWGNHSYIVLSSQNQERIVNYAPDKTNHLVATGPFQISFSQTISSVATFSDRFFILLSDGEVWSFPLSQPFGSQSSTPAQVFIQSPIPTPLAVAQGNSTAPGPVPTVMPVGSSGQESLVLPNATLLSVGVVNKVAHLYIGGSINHRVIDLTEASTSTAPGTPTPTPTQGKNPTSSVTMQLVQQYYASQELNSLKGMAVEPSGNTLHVLVQHSSSQVNLVSVDTGPQTGCAA
jgi:serine/threonine protein phosphatase PrpC